MELVFLENCLVGGGCLIHGNGWGNFKKSAIGGPPLFRAKEYLRIMLTDFLVIDIENVEGKDSMNSNI